MDEGGSLAGNVDSIVRSSDSSRFGFDGRFSFFVVRGFKSRRPFDSARGGPALSKGDSATDIP
jgi:hypothetical protein